MPPIILSIVLDVQLLRWNVEKYCPQIPEKVRLFCPKNLFQIHV